MLTDLLNDLDVISEYDKEDYQQLHFTKIEMISKKGTSEGAALLDGRWVPKSQMKCDFDKNLFVTLWMYSTLKDI